jgi:hypothetical protein
VTGWTDAADRRCPHPASVAPWLRSAPPRLVPAAPGHGLQALPSWRKGLLGLPQTTEAGQRIPLGHGMAEVKHSAARWANIPHGPPDGEGRKTLSAFEATHKEGGYDQAAKPVAVYFCFSQ